MKSRSWFLLSILLFVSAALFWRFGDSQRATRQNAKIAATKSAASTPDQRMRAAHTSSAKLGTSGKTLLAKPVPETNSVSAAATNAATLYPNRLKNTMQTLDQLVKNDRAILLRNALIDTGAETMKIPDELRSKGDPGSYIVQARGAVDASFRAALIEAKAEIISYVPNNAYLVRLPNGSKVLAGNKQVQSVLPYEPYYKLDTELLAMALDKKPLPLGKKLRVGLFPGQRDAAVEALKGKAQIIGEDLQSSPFGPELIVASADFVQLANLPQVQEIEPFYEREILNDLTRVRLGVASDPVTSTNFLDLTGSNTWVNVNDTTIDNGHPDLTGRIFPADGVGITDPIGHGTHVAGIIASSGVNSPGDSITNIGSVVGANFRGKAPGASILSQDIYAGLSDAELQRIAAETNYISLLRKSPLISNNSWGYGTRSYNSSAASYDAAVRDALPGSIGSQPVAYVFSAGNSGDGAGTIVSPATAKNVISVGAIESKRDLTNDVVRPDNDCVTVTNKEFLGSTDSSNQVAGFSSRGNVGIAQEGTFGRLKPDLVAPGTFIGSTRSRQLDEDSYYSPLHEDNNSYPNLVIDPLATNNFLIFIPDDPCDEGATLSLTIDANITSQAPPNSSLLIYAGPAPNPSSDPTKLIGANSVTIDRASLPVLDGILYYDIVNTNDLELVYHLRTSLVLSNDFGDTTNGYFAVLRTLNDYLAPNYMFESGTSMSAPAISGMLALMQEYFEQRFQITNSPAMMKALLINGSRAIGSGYNNNAAINDSGWGLPDLRRILPVNPDVSKWPVQLFDQSTNAPLATGERHDRLVTINDTNSPLRVTLVWTDPPGNPAVGVKLVNDLDLIVTTVATNGFDTNSQPVVTTNVYFGNNFSGGEFTPPSVLGTNGLSEFDAVRDGVNNVENVYINGPLNGQYTVSVVARRVNVNAVTAHTNGIVQDYALVISSAAGDEAPFAVDTNSLVGLPNTNAFVTVITNSFPTNGPSPSYGGFLTKQRVGANSPLINVQSNNLTDGATNQWMFYVLNNPSGFTNVAFLTFLPPNLSGATNLVPGSRRNVDADIDMYVSTDPTLTNLNPVAIAGADKSLKRGGQELVVFTNRNDAVFYVGIKSEDQRASEFSFFAIASDQPFGSEENGNLTLYGIPIGGVDIPDGSPDKPGGSPFIMIAVGDATIGRLVVTNSITHQRIGDLIETLTHDGDSGDISAVLLNHSFPDGQESGPVTLIYDDSGLDAIPGARHTDGPGSLLDFVGEKAVGAWIINVEDNAINSTGRIDAVTMFVERALETNDFTGGTGFTISGGIPSGQSRALSFVVPPNTTNMIISIAPKEGPLDTVVRQGRLAPTRSPYVDKGKLISPPGDILTVGTNDVPPLKPGRYVLRLFNDGTDFVNFTGFVQFQLDLTARSLETFTGGFVPVLDDALTNSIIHVDRDARVVSTEVSVHIDHPRVSDLVLHLVSPEGTRILLAENRGGLSTNGYGFSNLTTNTVSADGQTDGGAYTNVIPTTLNSGFVNINYNFFEVPDQLRIYYDGVRIFDSGLRSDSGSFSVPFGPGAETNIVIVMNEGGNTDPGTAWNYTATVLSGPMVYATFSENTNLALVPIKFAIPPFATNLPATNFAANSLIQNPSFESDLAGWDANSAGVAISPFIPSNFPTTDGTKAAELGINDVGGSILSQNFSAVGGSTYLLSFDLSALGDPGRVAITRVDITNSLGTVISQTFTNFARNTLPIPFGKEFIRFTVPQNDTNLTLRFVDLSPFNGRAVDALIDNIQLPSLDGDPNYFLPEESLKTLIGENAQGDWKLEIWDNRAGAPLGAAQLVTWQLHLTFASTIASATPLSNGIASTNTVAGSELQYFIIDVPISATRATNALVSFGTPLNLWFNQNDLPLGDPRLDDLVLLSSVTSGSKVLTMNTLPDLQPGKRYYLGVQNANGSLTNTFTLSVTFDNTNNLVSVTPLTNGIPLSTNLPLGLAIQYYQYDLSNTVGSIEFKLFGLSDDADLVVRRGQLPTESTFDFNSNLGGTNDETITVSTPTTGRYYLGVYGFFPTNGISYSVMVTEGGSTPQPAFLGTATVSADGFYVTASTIINRDYQFEVSLDLADWTTVSTTTAVANITTFHDPTSPETPPGARFYRIKLLP